MNCCSINVGSAKERDMSSILINNFPKMTGTLVQHNRKRNKWSNTPSGYTGFSASVNEFDDSRNSALRSIFLSLLLHDVVYLRHEDYLDFIRFLGVENVILLLERGIIKIVFDCYDFTYVNSKDAKAAKLGQLELTYFVRLAPLYDLQFGYCSIESDNRVAQARLRYLTEENQILVHCNENGLEITADSVANSIIDEVRLDLSNKRMLEELDLTAQPFSVKMMTSLRICEVLAGYSLQKQLEVDSVIQDSYSKDYVESKIFISSSDKSIDCFETILEMKSIPDVFDLYNRGLVSLKEILDMRESFQAKNFRMWLSDKNYDHEVVVRELLKPCSSSVKANMVSFIVPTVLGLINPGAGVIASATDSVFLKMLRDNWSPKLFLDSKLSRLLNEKIKHEKLKNSVNRQNGYSMLKSGDDCYCGSGKKYSVCHAKRKS
jgi:hypothetical protein